MCAAISQVRRVVKGTRSVVLPGCGHRPWMERQAAEGFFKVREDELLARR